MTSVSATRLISRGCTPDLYDWREAIIAAFPDDADENSVLLRELHEEEGAEATKLDLDWKELFFFVLLGMGKDHDRQAIGEEISWFGWIFLSWHITDFSPDDDAGVINECPLLAACEDEQSACWPNCDVLSAWARFFGRNPVRTEEIREESKRRFSLDRKIEDARKLRKEQLKLDLTKHPKKDLAKLDGVPETGANLLFLHMAEPKTSDSALEFADGDRSVTAYALGKYPKAVVPEKLIAQIMQGPRPLAEKRYAALQWHPKPTETAAETLLVPVDGKTVKVRRATFPIVYDDDCKGNDAINLSYLTAWIFEQPGKRVQKRKKPQSGILGGLLR